MQETNVTEKTTVQPAYLTVLRLVLGLILIWKGIVFIRDITLLQNLIEQTEIGAFSKNAEMLAFIVSYLTLLCGVFIGSGLFTRTMSIIQIPILAVAIFFVNTRGIYHGSFELILSIVTFILLLLFAIKGSGALSADEFFRSYYKAGTEQGNTGRFFRSSEDN